MRLAQTLKKGLLLGVTVMGVYLGLGQETIAHAQGTPPILNKVEIYSPYEMSQPSMTFSLLYTNTSSDSWAKKAYVRIGAYTYDVTPSSTVFVTGKQPVNTHITLNIPVSVRTLGYNTMEFWLEDNYGRITSRISKTIQFVDTIKPTIQLSSKVTTFINSGQATISYSVQDEYQLSKVTLPTNAIHTFSGASGTGSIVVNENGRYFFTVTDKAGNTRKEYIDVKGIPLTDSAPPYFQIVSQTINVDANEVVVEIYVKDWLNTIKTVTLPAGTVLSIGKRDYSFSFTVGTNGAYTVKTEDTKGNTNQLTIQVTNLHRPYRLTNSLNVNLELHAEDMYSGVKNMRIRNEDGSWSSWIAYKESYPWVLSGADGTKRVRVQYQDTAGNISPEVEDIIVLDRTAPVISKFVINNNDKYTNSFDVKANITAKDALTGLKSVWLSNDGKNYTEFRLREDQKLGEQQINLDWKMDGIQLERTVWMYLEDKAGNKSSVVTDKIIVDTIFPTGKILINNDDEYTFEPLVELTLWYEDNETGVEDLKLLEDDIVYTLVNPKAPNPFVGSPMKMAWTLQPGFVRTVKLQITDYAGNRTIVSDSIIVDKLTFHDFHLDNVVNPLSFDYWSPFEKKTWAFDPQPMIAGGNISFSVDIKAPYEPAVVKDTARYELVIQDTASGYYQKLQGQLIDNIPNHFEATDLIPEEAPKGSKVFIMVEVRRQLFVSPFKDQYVYFPGGTDPNVQAHIGWVQGHIKEPLIFNEIE